MYIYIYLYGSFIYDLSRQNLNPYIIIEFFCRIYERDTVPSFMLVALIRATAHPVFSGKVVR